VTTLALIAAIAEIAILAALAAGLSVALQVAVIVAAVMGALILACLAAPVPRYLGAAIARRRHGRHPARARRELDRQLAIEDLDIAAGRTRPLPLGDPDRDPARDCRYCGPPFDPRATCGCPVPCGDRYCGALTWQAVATTEEWER
jgi:hypothetical protein